MQVRESKVANQRTEHLPDITVAGLNYSLNQMKYNKSARQDGVLVEAVKIG